MRLLHPVLRDIDPAELYDLYDEPGPHLRAGFVASLDGVISVDGKSRGLQSTADLAVFKALRATCDAVLVGAGTLRSENYGPVQFSPEASAWRAAHRRSDEVPIVAVTRSGDLNDKVRQGPVLVTGVDVPTDLVELVAALHDRGLSRILCEGGPSLLRDLLAHELVDELCLTTAPLLVGDGPKLPGAAPLTLTSLVHDDPGVLLGRWRVAYGS